MIDLNDRAYSLYLGLRGLDYDEAGCRASIVAAMETLLRDAAAAIDTSDPGQFPDPGTRAIVLSAFDFAKGALLASAGLSPESPKEGR